MRISFRLLNGALLVCALILAQGIGSASSVGFGNIFTSDVTVGNHNSGNCYPYMCNDSGTSSGQSIDFQQVFAASSFSGGTTINAITWYFASEFGGNPIALGGSYTFSWGYAAFGSVNNLSTTLANNYTSGPNSLGTGVIPTGGINDNPTLTVSGFTPYFYDPSLGNLLLEIVVTNQDNVGNGTGNGYQQADNTGTVTSRAYCLTNVGCVADAIGLVTTFSTSASVPEPATFVLLSGGLLALGAARFRRSK